MIGFISAKWPPAERRLLIMNIHVIYCNNPESTDSTIIDMAEVYDFSIQANTGKLILYKKGMEPAMTWPPSAESIEALKFDWGHLVVDTPTFKDWAKRLAAFSEEIRKEASELREIRPFDKLLAAVNSSQPCNNRTVRDIAGDFSVWKRRAEQFGPQNFLDGYELMAKAFKTARGNGSVWIKHM